MSDSELRTLERSIDTLKDSFDKRVNDLKAGFDRVERIEREVKAGTFGSDPEALKNLRRRLDEVEAASKRLPYSGPGSGGESVGQLVIDSDTYKAFRPGSQSSSGLIEVKSFFPRESKADEITGASLGNTPGYLYQPRRVSGIIGPPMPQPQVRDLFPVYQLSEGAIEFPRLVSFTNRAAVQNETTIAAKAQSAASFELKSVSLKTVAHWIAASRQIVSDSASLRQFIDNLLIFGLGVVEDDEILNGTGGATSLEGLLTDEDVQTIAQGTSPSEADDNYADVIRRAMTLLETARYSATGIILHPSAWEQIELLKDEDGRYIWARVQETGVRRLWGLPVVTTVAVDSTQFVVGAFSQAAALWTREDATVRMSDQHSDFFTKNLVAILAEERLALSVFRPEAVVLGTFTGSGS